MPAHWFYSLKNLKETFEGGITGYVEPPAIHPESFMVGMSYQPDVERAKELGRPYDILHEHARFYNTTYNKLEIATDAQESEHGNATAREDERYHYHVGLNAGESTTAAELVRVLMRSIIDQGRYDEAHFLKKFVEFLSSGQRKDPYLEIYLRSWFENYASGKAIDGCAERQRNVWSIGSHGGMIRPMVLSLMADTSYQGIGFAIEHQGLTHRSENVAAALGVTIPFLHTLISGGDPMETAHEYARRVRVPEISGKEMFKMYRDHDGPGNIPDREMWRLHTRLSDDRFDLREWSKLAPEEVVLTRLATACYPEHGLPLAMYFAAANKFDVRKSLLADANAGGDNVHRSAVLGMIVGAATESFPDDLVEGLENQAKLKEEIEAFAGVAIKRECW